MYPVVLWACILLKQKLALLFISGLRLTLFPKLSWVSAPPPPAAARTHEVLFPVPSPRDRHLRCLQLHTTTPDAAMNILVREPLQSWVLERSRVIHPGVDWPP